MESSESNYDVIVIGAGLSGLTAAAWLAKAGRKVLLLEKEPRVGGYFGPVVHGSYYFNNGPLLLMGCNADGPYGPGLIHSLLGQLGVEQQCEFIPVQPFTTVRTPGLEFRAWSGREAFVEGLRAACPGGFERLPELLGLCGRIHQAGLSYYSAERPWGLAKVAGQLARIWPYQYATLENVLRRYIPLELPRNILGALWPFFGLPPRRASFFYWAVLMASYIDEGAYFCKGGLHRLSQTIADSFERDGGDLLLGTAIQRVLLRDQRVEGVELTDGRQYFAGAVIATIDPRQVFGQLVEAGRPSQRYVERIERMELSVRAINLSLVTDLDLAGLGLGYETLIVGDLDAERAWQELEAGRPGVFGLTVMDAADPGMAPPGEHIMNIFCSLPSVFEPSTANIRGTARELLAAVEQHIPALTDHLLLAQRGEVPDGYLTSIYEPIYGWASSPRHAALRRLGPVTPVQGLILAGQWTRPGQGAMGVILSGLQAARRVLG